MTTKSNYNKVVETATKFARAKGQPVYVYNQNHKWKIHHQKPTNLLYTTVFPNGSTKINH